MQEESEAAPDPHPIIPTSEKAVGAIDVGLITGAAAIFACLLVVRWAKLRTATRLIGKAAQDDDTAG
jgi:hypothetical protein